MLSASQLVDVLQLSGQPVVKKNKIKKDLVELSIKKLEYLLNNSSTEPNSTRLFIEIVNSARLLVYKPGQQRWGN